MGNGKRITAAEASQLYAGVKVDYSSAELDEVYDAIEKRAKRKQVSLAWKKHLSDKAQAQLRNDGYTVRDATVISSSGDGDIVNILIYW